MSEYSKLVKRARTFAEQNRFMTDTPLRTMTDAVEELLVERDALQQRVGELEAKWNETDILGPEEVASLMQQMEGVTSERATALRYLAEVVKTGKAFSMFVDARKVPADEQNEWVAAVDASEDFMREIEP